MNKYLFFSTIFYISITCNVSACSEEGREESYSRFSDIVFEPIVKDDKVTGLILKTVNSEQSQEAINCIRKAVELGHWKAAYTLHEFYKFGRPELNIKKDSELADYYYRAFLDGKKKNENNT